MELLFIGDREQGTGYREQGEMGKFCEDSIRFDNGLLSRKRHFLFPVSCLLFYIHFPIINPKIIAAQPPRLCKAK